MKRSIIPIVNIKSLHESDTDFAYWQTQTFEKRIATLEELRHQYVEWMNSIKKEPSDVQSGFQRVYRIVKH